MSYITLAQLAEGPGMLEELAQPFNVPAPLLAATIAAGDRSQWTPEERSAADEAIVSIGNTAERASAEMETYLAKRGYVLPMSAVQFPVLTSWCRNIARYHLQPQRDRTNEESGRIERDYRSALRALEFIAAGKIDLGAGDPTSSGSAGSPDYVESERIFTRDTLAGF